ncbi:uncharacterized protein LOC113866860 [Abrus precatorius]|uniref:Uncharacterized protein LOC113866860 n=1 Tax=Abrus precatorius TaxID=3816 RepID=A0A8B8LMH5_ABRPR|nr:uncharacterized protein LOC113866860 [Abrus precatorius]
MNSSAFSSLFFALSLILISHVPFPTSGANLIESVCNDAMEDQVACLQLLQSEPRFATAKNYVHLSKMILEMGVKKGEKVQNELKEMMMKNPSPAITQCATTLYDGVVGSFKSSLGEMKEDGLTANYDAKVAGDGPATCDRALAAANIVNPTISALNKEILLISKIAFLATNELPESP